MNVERTHKIHVVLNAGDIIQALRAYHPADINIQALPLTGEGCTLDTVGGVVSLVWMKRAKPVPFKMGLKQENSDA